MLLGFAAGCIDDSQAVNATTSAGNVDASTSLATSTSVGPGPDAGPTGLEPLTGSSTTGLGTTSSTTESSSDETGSTAPDIPIPWWTYGLAPNRVLGSELVDLPGGLTEDPLWVSNNPERVFGPGWLFQHARVDPIRGGEARSLERFVAYMFHLNASGAPLTFHLIATNPGVSPVELTALGSLYDNAQFPISPGEGPSVAVAEEYLQGGGNVDVSLDLAPSAGAEVGRIEVADNGILDGRLVVESTGAVFLYMVATSSGSVDDAINLSQGDAASGEILEPGPNAFGRMAGVYSNAQWTADFDVEVPPSPAHVGIALNTSDKFQLDGETLQSQTASALMHLSDSSDESFGNYGMSYSVRFRLCAEDGSRTVGLRFGSNFVDDVDVPSFTWGGPLRINGKVVDVTTRPTAPSVPLSEHFVPAGGCSEVLIDFVVPGLITGGQQLVLESR